MKKKYNTVFLVLLMYITVTAQDLKSEFGFFTGLVSMQTDYGERGHFGSSYANIGFGVGGVYYMSFDDQRKRWNDKMGLSHFRIRAELSYIQVNLKHRGKYTYGNSNFTKLYNAMDGKASIFNYGMQLEYALFSFSGDEKFNPYLSLGFLGNRNKSKITSSLGDVALNSNLLPSIYRDGINTEATNSTAIIVGVGTRIKPKNNFKSTYLIDFRWQRFNSDLIEGLSPKIEANKYNDWLFFVSVGYVFN